MKFGYVEVENYFEAQHFYAHQQTNQKIDTQSNQSKSSEEI